MGETPDRERVEKTLSWMQEQSGDSSLTLANAERFLVVFDARLQRRRPLGETRADVAQWVFAYILDERALLAERVRTENAEQARVLEANRVRQARQRQEARLKQTAFQQARRPSVRDQFSAWLDQPVKSYRSIHGTRYSWVKRRDSLWELGLVLGFWFVLVPGIVIVGLALDL